MISPLVSSNRYVPYAVVGVHLVVAAALCVLIVGKKLPDVLSPLIGVQAGLLGIWAVLGMSTLRRRVLGLFLGATLLGGFLFLLVCQRDLPNRYRMNNDFLEFLGQHFLLWEYAGLVAGTMVVVCLLAIRPGVRFRRVEANMQERAWLANPNFRRSTANLAVGVGNGLVRLLGVSRPNVSGELFARSRTCACDRNNRWFHGGRLARQPAGAIAVYSNRPAVLPAGGGRARPQKRILLVFRLVLAV